MYWEARLRLASVANWATVELAFVALEEVLHFYLAVAKSQFGGQLGAELWEFEDVGLYRLFYLPTETWQLKK